MARMSLFVNHMRLRVDEWKAAIKQKIEEKSPNLNGIKGLMGDHEDDSLLVHYTARWPLIINYIGAICCFGFSAVFHLFKEHSKKIMTVFVKFDYAGICLMIAGSSTPPIYYAFACQQLQQWRFFYLGLIYFLCSLTLILMMLPYFDRDDMSSYRAGLYLLTGLSALFPVTHIILFVEPQYLQNFHLPTWTLGGLFYVVGAAAYAM